MKSRVDPEATEAQIEHATDLGNRPILIGKDRRANWITSHVVKRNGDDPYTIRRVDQEVGNSGYRRLTLKMIKKAV